MADEGTEPVGAPPPAREKPTRRVHYTVYIKVPFPRNGFVDPPLVDWDSTKDEALWEVLARNKTSDLDWQELANRFDVTVTFLLQQVAWLYERRQSQLREQVQRFTVPTASPSPSPAGEEKQPGSIPMQKQGSRDSVRQARPESASVDAGPATPRGINSRSRGNSWQGKAPPISRTASTNTITQSRPGVPASPSSLTPASRTPVSPPRAPQVGKLPIRSEEHKPSYEDSDSDSSSGAPVQSYLSKSQVFRRAPRFRGSKPPTSALGDHDEVEGEGEDDDEPAFFTLATADDGGQDLGATLRTGPQGHEANQGQESREPVSVTRISSTTNTDSSASSLASSAAPVSSPRNGSTAQAPTGPTRPRPRGGGHAVSPRDRVQGLAREGSDGAPSMGSSFSDLDDASVTQSALEEALMSNLGHGSVTSRMSNLTQTFRSRYMQ